MTFCVVITDWHIIIIIIMLCIGKDVPFLLGSCLNVLCSFAADHRKLSISGREYTISCPRTISEFILYELMIWPPLLRDLFCG